MFSEGGRTYSRLILCCTQSCWGPRSSQDRCECDISKRQRANVQPYQTSTWPMHASHICNDLRRIRKHIYRTWSTPAQRRVTSCLRHEKRRFSPNPHPIPPSDATTNRPFPFASCIALVVAHETREHWNPVYQHEHAQRRVEAVD